MPQAASISGVANSIEAKVVGADYPGSAFAQLIGAQDLPRLMRRRPVASLTLRCAAAFRSVTSLLLARSPQGRAGVAVIAQKASGLGLNARSPRGEIVVADDHAGLRTALREALAQAAYQRCYVLYCWRSDAMYRAGARLHGRGERPSRAQLEPPRCCRRTAFAEQRRTALAPATSLRHRTARFRPSNSILELGQITQWHYPEKSGFGRSMEREWVSPIATLVPELETPHAHLHHRQ
jgi:hypothetical protein